LGLFKIEPDSFELACLCRLPLSGRGLTLSACGCLQIDENPIDGDIFDRSALEEVGQEGVTLVSSRTELLRPEVLSEKVMKK
jgi:hypothetical protein